MADCGNENGNAIGGLPDLLQGLAVSDDNKQREDQIHNKKSPESKNLTEGCSICQEDMKIDTGLKKLPTCEHIFHLECIDRWLQKHVRCPICRSDVGKEYLLALRLQPCTNDGTACLDSDIESDDESFDVFGSGEQDYDGGSREHCRWCGMNNHNNLHYCPHLAAQFRHDVRYNYRAHPLDRYPPLSESLQAANIICRRIYSCDIGNSAPSYAGPPVNGAHSRYAHPPPPRSAPSANINQIYPRDFSNSTHVNARPPVYGVNPRYGYPPHPGSAQRTNTTHINSRDIGNSTPVHAITPVFGANSRYGYPQHSANNTRFY